MTTRGIYTVFIAYVASNLVYDTQGTHMIIIIVTVAFGIVYNNLWYIYHLAASIIIDIYDPQV